ncbi:hypothetical protein ACWDRB_63370 [Nonomuraea sp. NPDC003707]
MLRAKENLQRLLAAIPLTDDERAAVDDGQAALDHLLDRLTDTPTPAGPTPRQLDPAQVPRLLQIEDNTRERLAEAKRMQWLGEVAALEESLRHITEKKLQADRLKRSASRGDIGSDALA